MKTQLGNVKGSRFLKNLFLILTIAMLAISCGQDNTSGQPDNINNTGIGSGFGTGGFGDYGSYTGVVSVEQALNTIANERVCIQGGQRQRISIQFNGNVNLGSVHFGVSTFGDIAVVHGLNGQRVMDAYICPRSGAQFVGLTQLTQYILENSAQCPISQISYGFARINTQQGQFDLGFAPIHVPGTDRISSLCTQ